MFMLRSILSLKSIYKPEEMITYIATQNKAALTFLIYRNMCPIVDKYFHERAKVRKNKQNKAFGGKLFIFLSKYMSFI